MSPWHRDRGYCSFNWEHDILENNLPDVNWIAPNWSELRLHCSSGGKKKLCRQELKVKMHDHDDQNKWTNKSRRMPQSTASDSISVQCCYVRFNLSCYIVCISLVFFSLLIGRRNVKYSPGAKSRSAQRVDNYLLPGYIRSKHNDANT